MKKVMVLVGFLLAVPTISAKSWITMLQNNSPFYVTYQNTDPSAKSIVNGNNWLRKEAYIVGPKNSINLEDSVVPWQNWGGIIRITVSGVESNGTPFTKTQATLQESDGNIWFDTGTKRDKIGRSDTYVITVDKDGSVMVK